jgi:hypothetical protein
MAGLRLSVQTDLIVTGTVKKTILQLVAPANHRLLVKEISVSFNGRSSTALPINVQVERQSSAGTMTALTPRKINTSDDETPLSSAQHTATVQPTSGEEVLGENVHPQGGSLLWQAPFGGEIVIKGGERLGIAIKAANTTNVKARFIYDE